VSWLQRVWVGVGEGVCCRCDFQVTPQGLLGKPTTRGVCCSGNDSLYLGSFRRDAEGVVEDGVLGRHCDGGGVGLGDEEIRSCSGKKRKKIHKKVKR
jgi:hypothetical protein